MKKLVFILMSLCLWTVARSQGVKILAPISTNDPTDTYPTHVDSLGMGGYMSVSSITSRNNIPEARRKAGMLVYVKGIDSTYQLQDDLTTWTSFKLGGTTDTTNLSFRIDTVASHIGEVGTDTTFGANAPVTISRSGNKVTYGVDTANAAHGLATKDNLNAVKDSIDAIKEHPLSVIQPLYIKGDTAIAIDTSRAAHNAATQYYADSLSRKVVHDSLSTVSGVNLGNSNLINIPAYGTRIFNTNGGELHFVNNSGSYRFVIDNDGVYFKGNVFTPFNNDDPGNKFLTTGVDGAMELQSLPIDTAFATDNTLRIYRSGNLITYKADTSKIATIKAVMDSISNHSGGSGTDTITEVHAPLLKSISGNKQIITADTSAGSTHIATQNFVTQAIADIPSGSDSAIAVDETMTKSVSGNIITLGVNGDIIVDTSTISDDSAHLDNTNIFNSSGAITDAYRALNIAGGVFAVLDTTQSDPSNELLHVSKDSVAMGTNVYLPNINNNSNLDSALQVTLGHKLVSFNLLDRIKTVVNDSLTAYRSSPVIPTLDQVLNAGYSSSTGILVGGVQTQFVQIDNGTGDYENVTQLGTNASGTIIPISNPHNVTIVGDSDYTVTDSDKYIILSNPSVERTLTLPTSSAEGRELTIVCKASGADKWQTDATGFVASGLFGSPPYSPEQVSLASTQVYRLVWDNDSATWFQINN